MSLSQNIVNSVNNSVETYVTCICDKYGLDFGELMELWNDSPTKSTKPTKLSKLTKSSKPVKEDGKQQATESDSDKPSVEMSDEELGKFKKPELQDLCRQQGVKCSGTKTQLIEYLRSNVKGRVPGNSTNASDKPKSSKTSKSAVTKPEVQTKIASSIPNVNVKRNRYGNFENPETHFVFDRDTKEVVGKQGPDGEVTKLTLDDIQTCKQMNLLFRPPENLNNDQDDGEDEELEEMEDEDVEDEVDDVEEVEDDLELVEEIDEEDEDLEELDEEFEYEEVDED